jgi:hypothetical protein
MRRTGEPLGSVVSVVVQRTATANEDGRRGRALSDAREGLAGIRLAPQTLRIRFQGQSFFEENGAKSQKEGTAAKTFE